MHADFLMEDLEIYSIQSKQNIIDFWLLEGRVHNLKEFAAVRG